MIMSSPVKERAVIAIIRATVESHSDIAGDLLAIHALSGEKSQNTIVKALLSSSIVYSSRVRAHWRGLLYVNGV